MMFETTKKETYPFPQWRPVDTFPTSIQFRHNQILHLMCCRSSRKINCVQHEFVLRHFFHATYDRCTFTGSRRTDNHNRLSNAYALVEPIYYVSSFFGRHHNLCDWRVWWYRYVFGFEPRPPSFDHVKTVIHC